jgi:protein-S-isoprenylcysteine O-methyltransferase Ste14
MHVIDYVVLACWIAFWVYWLAAALGAKSSSHWHPVHAVGSRVVVVLVVLTLVRAGVFRHAGNISDPVLQGIGVALFLAGLALAVWARVCLGRNWGHPMSERAEPELVTTGPYRRIRHPIYSGIILGLLGTMLAVSWYWAVAVVGATGFFVYSAFVEERTMARRFPDAYPQYQRRTKMLIPFVL